MISIDKELIKKYLGMFWMSLAILGGALFITLILLVVTVREIGPYTQNSKKIKETKTSIEQKRADLQRIKDDIAKEEKEKLSEDEVKKFYRDISSSSGLTSDVLAGEIQEINDLIKYYGIKIYKVNYIYDDENDAFYKGKKEKYSVCKMDLELFSNYMKFQGFLNDLYKHEHFLNIQSIEIKPYKKDKSILNINMTISLYAEKEVNSAVNNANTAAPQSNTSDMEVTVEF